MQDVSKNMEKRYPCLGKYIAYWQELRLLKERRRLVHALRDGFQHKFQNAYCVWKTTDGKLVMCLDRARYYFIQFPPLVPVAPIAAYPPYDREKLFYKEWYREICKVEGAVFPWSITGLICRGIKSAPAFFSFRLDGKTMYVHLKNFFWSGLGYLDEFVCRLSGDLPPEDLLSKYYHDSFSQLSYWIND